MLVSFTGSVKIKLYKLYSVFYFKVMMLMVLVKGNFFFFITLLFIILLEKGQCSVSHHG